MDTYTSNDGHTQLLLCLHGTIPITYRSIPYNIPVAFWVPREYPNSSPIPYVKPTASMLIREGRHVDKSGLCYHQYRSSWSSDQKHNLLELVAILQQVFAQEPPVYTKPNAATPTPPTIGSPQFQESLLENRNSPTQQRQNMPLSNHKPPSPWMNESTALYNLNQGLASMHLSPSSTTSKSASLPTISPMPAPHVPSPPARPNTTDSYTMNNKNLHEALYRKLTDRIQQYNVSLSGEMDKLLIQNRQLNEGEAIIEKEYRALSDLKERLQFNQLVLETRSKEVDDIINKVNAMPDVQIDETICGTSVVGNQLFELVADDNAISDTVYFLAKALNSERIDLATFMKRVTNYKLLCRSISTVKQVKPTYIKSPLTSTTTPFQQLQGKRWTFMNQKRNATTTHDLSYKQTPFLQWKLFPDFEHLVTQTAPAIAVPAFQKLIEAAKAQFVELEKTFEPTWEGTIGKLTELEDEISRAYGILSHLNGVKNTADIRTTLEKIQPDFVKLGLMMNQSFPKYKALEELRNTPEQWNKLDKVQQRIVEHTLRDMKHAGIGFPPDSVEKKRFNEISERLSYLSLTFGNNVLDATNSFKEVITDKDQLVGCSETFLETLRKNAERHGIKEGYCITLDFPIYGPFMTNCKNRELREKIYRANITKASSGAVNNEPIINEILALKKEKAKLLGYETPADLSLSVKMAQSLQSAESLLDSLFDAALPHAKKELDELTQFASNKLNHPTPLQPWDTGYVTEQYRKELFKYDEETISQYFAFPKVLKGLFDVANEVLGIQVRELSSQDLNDKKITRWHEDVKVFEVSEKGKTVAYFYGDFYSRPSEKRSGAWMDIVTTRFKHQDGQVTLPVAYLICNQPPPQSDKEPSLMKFRDVETLFHEFGHCLQHMMTTVDYAPASGINGIEWDFVEVASQFMENFCSEPEWIHRLSGHYKSGEAIPKDMVSALVKGREFMSGLATLRQLHFSKLDLALHSRFTPPTSDGDLTIFDVDAKIAQQTVLTPRLPEDRFLCSFSHIFGGGYSAGYYRYVL
ncbi:hypothetical protein G6F62_004308 [Rhizopus arrhizus]|nr:hypothetical protein G6F62_004308 [Rhizopus arrhizus]